MSSSALRRLLFDRIFINLALVLGFTQVLLWHWVGAVMIGGAGPGIPAALGVGGALVVGNGLAVPVLRRTRRRADWIGGVARGYMNLGVSTLLLGITVAGSWLLFGLFAGLLGVFGAGPDFAFGLFRVTSGASVGSVALLLLWGFTFGQSKISYTRLRVAIPGLSEDLVGLRIVQISDLHIGNGLEAERLERMIARTNALDPDVIVVTGDIFDFDPAFIEDGVARLAGLRARYGVYAILGNHDVYTGRERVAEAFERLAPGVRLLRDELVKLPVDAPLYLVGVEDPGQNWSARGVELEPLEELAGARPADGPTLLLVHRPEAFAQAVRLGFPLVLAGHTHGGQLALPTPGGRFNLASLVTPFTRGVFREHGTTMYVNRGLGVGGPALRINCPREIATIELAAA